MRRKETIHLSTPGVPRRSIRLFLHLLFFPIMQNSLETCGTFSVRNRDARGHVRQMEMDVFEVVICESKNCRDHNRWHLPKETWQWQPTMRSNRQLTAQTSVAFPSKSNREDSLSLVTDTWHTNFSLLLSVHGVVDFFTLAANKNFRITEVAQKGNGGTENGTTVKEIKKQKTSLGYLRKSKIPHPHETEAQKDKLQGFCLPKMQSMCFLHLCQENTCHRLWEECEYLSSSGFLGLCRADMIVPG